MISIRCHTKQQQRICCCSEGNDNRHPERMWRICYRDEGSCKMIKAVSCKLTILLRFKSLRQASILNRTTCASSFFWRRVPWSLCKKRYWRWDFIRSNRFFTPCHYSVSRLSHTVFLQPFWMTIGGKGIIIRETLIVILNECEGSVTVMREMKNNKSRE